jgi:CRP-like cAMP-binding protein
LEALGREPGEGGTGWASRLVEILQPATVRAGQLASMTLFEGLGWPELEAVAGLLDTVEVRRGTRLTVQGRYEACLWLIVEGHALLSADARPLRVMGHGDAIGVASVLYGIRSQETTIALSPIRALVAGPDRARDLAGRPRLGRQLTAVAGEQLRFMRLLRRP